MFFVNGINVKSAFLSANESSKEKGKGKEEEVIGERSFWSLSAER